MKPLPFIAELQVVKSYKDTNGEFHIVGYAATSDFDLQGDVITRSALKQSEGDLIKNSTMLFNHDDGVPIGKVVKSNLDEKGLLIDAMLDQEAVIPKTGTKVVNAVKNGFLNKFSIRGQVMDAVKEYVAGIGRMANVIKRMMLVEVSLVSVPANPEAEALNWYIRKALDEREEAAMNRQELIKKAGELNVAITDDMTDDDITKAISKAVETQGGEGEGGEGEGEGEGGESNGDY